MNAHLHGPGSGRCLGGMRQLQALSLDLGFLDDDLNYAKASPELLTAIGAMPQLEYLRLAGCEDRERILLCWPS